MSPERIERIILLVRGHRVMVDTDLAALYGVDTKTLNRAVKAKPRTVSGRLHVPAHARGNRRLEVPNWHLKFGARGRAVGSLGRPPLPALCVHGARGGHAFECPSQSTSRSGERRGHADLRTSPLDAGLA